MHQGEYRVNGGLGFAIKKPYCELTFTPTSKFKINELRFKKTSSAEQLHLLSILNAEQKKYGFDIAFNVTIEGTMLIHSGFGSGTATSLACLEALHLLNSHPVTQAELTLSSTRGGTSGIGIHTYFNGGCVIDLGKPVTNHPHAPSNKIQAKQLPLLLDEMAMPNWDIGICIPNNIRTKTQAEEQSFFERTCPIPAESAYETVYHTLLGLYAALKENNKDEFCKAVNAVQKCMWKKLERDEYGQDLTDIEHTLFDCGAQAVGMSSLGPSLFFLADNVDNIITEMQSKRNDCNLFVTAPNNLGRSIKYD